MNRYFSIFIIFASIAFAAVGGSLYGSWFLSFFATKAEGFGISPPYVQGENLKPGDSFEQRVAILRSSAQKNARAGVVINAPAIKDWIAIEPGDLIEMPAGLYNVPFKVKVTIPDDARPGTYSGSIILNFFTDSGGKGTVVNTGALITVYLKVAAGPEKTVGADYIVNSREFYEKYKGSFLTISTSTLYYLDNISSTTFAVDSAKKLEDIIKNKSIGITNDLLAKIPVGLYLTPAMDTDKDGLDDKLEEALGTNIEKADTDGDSFRDLDELKNGFSPVDKNEAAPIDLAFTKNKLGQFFMQVESKGQVWYVNPGSSKRYFLPDIESGLKILNNLAVVLSGDNFTYFQALTK